jgi:hypothetical protein
MHQLKVFEYYTNPDNIKQAWPRDIIKESESLYGSNKNEEGSEMKVKGEYMGREDEMILEVTEKEQNKRLVTQQKEGHSNLGQVDKNLIKVMDKVLI